MQWPPKRGAGHCPCGSCSLIQPAHGLQKTAGAGGGQRFRAAVCILSSLVPPIAVLANTAHGHSDVQFIQGRLPVASFSPVPVAGRHLVVSGLWPSVLLECCIWQRYVLIFISQCHCEHLFHRLPWDFFYCLQSCAVAVAVSRCLPVCFSCFVPSVLQPRLLLSVAVHGFHAAPSVFCLHALCRLLFRCFGKFDGVCLRILMLFS